MMNVQISLPQKVLRELVRGKLNRAGGECPDRSGLDARECSAKSFLAHNRSKSALRRLLSLSLSLSLPLSLLLLLF